MIQRGYRVFWLRDEAESVAIEIENIVALGGQVAVFIENYTRRLEDIKQLALRRSANLLLVLTARSVLHEATALQLGELLSHETVFEINVDKLSTTELRDISNLLTKYKLWGERDAWAPERKIGHLKENGASEWHSILLGVIKSPDIRARFETYPRSRVRHATRTLRRARRPTSETDRP